MRPLKLSDDIYPIHIQKFERKWYACGSLSGYENSFFDLCASYDARRIFELLTISGADFSRVVNHNAREWNDALTSTEAQ
jgi:hypothetical protein